MMHAILEPSTRTSTRSVHVPARRSTEPEIFTFDAVPPEQQQQRTSPPRARRRVTRVLYPARVRRYLPPAEKNPAKRLLLALCLLLLAQIYTERAEDELLHETETRAEGTATHGDQSALIAHALTQRGAWSNNRSQKLESVTHNGYVVALLYPVYHTLGPEQ